ncbi:uncharacterized protein LOC118283111 isoform X1 [Scophthalmus maximus]|uniref:uncharacterized protein LOC118283111 isoform X1 n=1 Tax=Scophthalmus maximus TaxID=52904 RepID=UPI001FA86DA3|nr:uncharacterized protein LOC118283111 isoform X1 [Scophthalmus maximus]XP_035460711.2 uncharacterized protein LOC118283111 isoform X1 [Scophthalmus maximus]XP_035460712.2 uncharacterized protein LOC118283111 isoform X1 [Scophthalmus maximus]XP_035460713.2 uncharacterized protein LOC118283111 isoform X1 [Scophthalmus maximus]
MFRPDERDPERDVDCPRRRRHLPSYVQDFEVKAQGSQRYTIEELTEHLKQAGLPSQDAALSAATSGESSSSFEDAFIQIADRMSSSSEGYSAEEQMYQQEGRECFSPGAVPRLPDDKVCPLPDEGYQRHFGNHSRPTSSCQPSGREHDHYDWQDGRHNLPKRRNCPEDRNRPSGRHRGVKGLDSGLEKYCEPMPTIPNFVHEDPGEFLKFKLALDCIVPADASEGFKYQVLINHLKYEDALLVAESYSNSLSPFRDTMRALTEMFGQPHQLASKRISNLMDGPNIRTGDVKAFRSFAVQIRALVGILQQMGRQSWTELDSFSHATGLLGKLPYDLRANFYRFVQFIHNPVPNLLNLAEWLEHEMRVQVNGSQGCTNSGQEKQAPCKDHRTNYKCRKTTTSLHGSEQSGKSETAVTVAAKETTQETPKKFCPFCDTVQHHMSQCSNFKLLSREQKTEWIKTNHRCWRCGREHQPAKCTLKAKCKQCKRKHLEVLHEVNTSQSAAASGRKLPGHFRPLVADWSEEDVQTWLHEEGLEELVGIFKANNIDGPELSQLDKETAAELGIESVGLRGRLLRKTEALKSEQSDSEVPDEFMCPITTELMKDPVIAADGYSYERESIETWIRGKNKTSPMTNLALQTTLLTPNRSLKMAITRWKSSQ